MLVPFAERLPVLDLIPPLRDAAGRFLTRTMGFSPGWQAGRHPVVHTVAGHRIGVLICYGDTIPGPGEDLARAGAEALFTLSNEGWFARPEHRQHLIMAMFRSIETRLPMARATNTGVTCLIDPTGRVAP